MRVARLLGQVVIVMLLAVGIATVLIYLRNETLTAVRLEAEPILVVATEVPRALASNVVVDLEWAPGGDILSPAWDGTITAVNIAPGEHVPSSDPPVEVDGRRYRWFVSRAPLYRTIVSRASGPDVEAVRSFLTELGYLSEGDAESDVGTSDLDAFRAYAADHGFDEAVSAKSLFEPSWIVWLPNDEEGALADVAIRLGAPAPPAGTPIATFAPRLVAVAVREEPTNVIAALAASAAQAHLSLAGVDFPWPHTFVPGDLMRLEAALAESYSGDEPPETADGSITWELQHQSASVPAAAVVADVTGWCVWIAAGITYEPAAVDVVGGDVDVAFVVGIDPGDRVLANPTSVGHLDCGHA